MGEERRGEEVSQPELEETMYPVKYGPLGRKVSRVWLVPERGLPPESLLPRQVQTLEIHSKAKAHSHLGCLLSL